MHASGVLGAVVPYELVSHHRRLSGHRVSFVLGQSAGFRTIDLGGDQPLEPVPERVEPARLRGRQHRRSGVVEQRDRDLGKLLEHAEPRVLHVEADLPPNPLFVLRAVEMHLLQVIGVVVLESRYDVDPQVVGVEQQLQAGIGVR